MKIYFITGNKYKLGEVKEILPFVEGLSLDLPEIQSLDAREVIAEKLKEASKVHDGPFMVEDTSLSLDCMQGLPGTFIKFFLEKLGREGLAEIAELKQNYVAEAKTCIGYLEHKDAKPVFFEGRLKGRIKKPSANSNFGWDPIFVPKGHDRSFAEMTSEEKNSLSMRKLAVEQLANYLDDQKEEFILEK